MMGGLCRRAGGAGFISPGTLRWLASHGVKFETHLQPQSFEKDGRQVFLGRFNWRQRMKVLALFDMELAAVERLRGNGPVQQLRSPVWSLTRGVWWRADWARNGCLRTPLSGLWRL